MLIYWNTIISDINEKVIPEENLNHNDLVYLDQVNRKMKIDNLYF